MNTETADRQKIAQSPVVEREKLREELEKTHAAFHELLGSVTDEQWLQKSPSSAWTVREVFVHLTWALEYLTKEVSQARRGRRGCSPAAPRGNSSGGWPGLAQAWGFW